MLWILLAVSYIVSVVAILAWLASFAFQEYCNYGRPWVEQGLAFTNESIQTFKPILEQTVSVIDGAMVMAEQERRLAKLDSFVQRLTNNEWLPIQIGTQFINSPIYLILHLIGKIIGFGQDRQWFLPIIERSLSYAELLSSMCRLNHGLPDAFLRLIAIAILSMVGAYILSEYHLKASTVFYYQTKLRRARSQTLHASSQDGDKLYA